MRRTSIRTPVMVLVLAGLALAGTAPAGTRARSCRRACRESLAACAGASSVPRACRRSLLRRCKVVGPSICAASAPSTPLEPAAQTPQGDFLFLSRFQFDPAAGEPELPAEQTTEYAPGETGFHLVQLVGPTEHGQLDALADAGADVVQFQPSHAYIVRMTPEQAAVVRALPFVRAVLVYQAAYRIAPSVLPSEGPDGPKLRAAQVTGVVENVDVTIFDDGTVGETIAAIEALGGKRLEHFEPVAVGRLVTAIFAIPADAIVGVAQLNRVLWLNFSSPAPGVDDEMSDQILAGNFTAGVPATGYTGWLGGLGLSGTGLRLAIVDNGIDYNHPDLTIVAGVSYDGAALAGDACNGHGTHVAGIAAGNASTGIADAGGFLWGLGVAPQTGLVALNGLCGPWPPTGGWQTFSRDSVQNGAVASNNSWFTGASGAQGYSAVARTHDLMVRDADFGTTATAEPLVMVFSAGNAGPGASTLTEPHEAKNLIVVANSQNTRALSMTTTGNLDAITGSSSRGPALDGRLLPNVAAPGTQIASARSDTGTQCTTNAVPGAGAMNYSFCTGTSMASPHVAGSVVLVVEQWRAQHGGATPSAAMVKALLVNGAVNMLDEDNNAATADVAVPNALEGWGRVNLTNVLDPPLRVLARDQATVFDDTGDAWTIRVAPADATQPLKVTLAWSDAAGPGSGGATGAWVNDLDLRATQGSTTWLGNVFANGASVAGGTPDTQNNVENVFLQTPSGVYDVEVRATNVAGDGVPLAGDATDQDFAFVCSNCDQPPICDAGGPYLKECGGAITPVTLDGTGSSDPDGDPITFAWSGPFVGGTAVGATPTVSFGGMGAFTVDLEVSDGMASSQCDAAVTIADTTPPVVDCTVALDTLFPPNHRLVDVGLTSTALDTCSGTLPVAVAVYGNEDDETATGDGRFAPDAVVGDDGLRLRAERKGDGTGRIYLVVATATDAAGLSGHACCSVVVPHAGSRTAGEAVRARAAAAEAICRATGAPPSEFVALGDGPAIGPKQ